MSLDAKALYALLPAVYRTRDAVSGGQLEALFAVLAQQSDIVADNIAQLYADQFIETCAPWAIPYIGDLIGYNSIYELTSTSRDTRAEVANTIGSRRRKGTLLALEQVSHDVSGRPAIAVEEFRRLITTVSLRHVEADRRTTVDIRNGAALARLRTPFEALNHTIDVRRIAPRFRHAARPDAAPLDLALHGPGRFNIPNVAIHLWRLRAWQVTGAPAFAVDPGRYRFSPLGADMPLFSRPPDRTPFDRLSTRADVPEPIRRDELLDHYGSEVALIEDGVPVDRSRVCAANLADRPGGAWCRVAPGMIAIDPELGRIQYAGDVMVPRALSVDYCYGFAGPLGGGVYDRHAALAGLPRSPGAGGAGGEFFRVATSAKALADAVTDWNLLAPAARGVIVLAGNDAYGIDLTGPQAVQLTPESSLAIVAASVSGGTPIFNDALVVLAGDIEVRGVAGSPSPDSSPPPTGQLLINGPWIAGRLFVTGGACTLALCDTTLVPGLGLAADGAPLCPGEPSVIVEANGATVIMNRAISGPLAAEATTEVRICGSIVDATAPAYVAFAGTDLASAGGDLHIEDSTVIGKVRTRTITLASNTIFDAALARRDPWPAPVWASRRQTGCVRFCSLPAGSITPRRYNCLPPDAASENALAPSFVSRSYGNPAYALLSGDCPLAVWTGAANGSQIGAYLQLQETEAVSNVQLRAPEYLPALLESGVFMHPSRPRPAPAPVPCAYGYGGLGAHVHEGDLPGIGAALI